MARVKLLERVSKPVLKVERLAGAAKDHSENLIRRTKQNSYPKEGRTLEVHLD